MPGLAAPGEPRSYHALPYHIAKDGAYDFTTPGPASSAE